jgi:hypothetical protein
MSMAEKIIHRQGAKNAKNFFKTDFKNPGVLGALAVKF